MTNSFSASDRSAGPILAAHPQVRDMPIRLFFLRKNMASSLPDSPYFLPKLKARLNPAHLQFDAAG
jgi:hypothetical protein